MGSSWRMRATNLSSPCTILAKQCLWGTAVLTKQQVYSQFEKMIVELKSAQRKRPDSVLMKKFKLAISIFCSDQQIKIRLKAQRSKGSSNSPLFSSISLSSIFITTFLSPEVDTWSSSLTSSLPTSTTPENVAEASLLVVATKADWVRRTVDDADDDAVGLRDAAEWRWLPPRRWRDVDDDDLPPPVCVRIAA